MRNFNVKGLSRAALEGTYEAVLVQKLIIEEKIERIKSELAVAFCAIEDGHKPEDIKLGLANLIYFIEQKIPLSDLMCTEKEFAELGKLTREQNEKAEKLLLEKIRARGAKIKKNEEQVKKNNVVKLKNHKGIDSICTKCNKDFHTKNKNQVICESCADLAACEQSGPN